MPNEIKCPNCGNRFPMEQAVSEEYKKELRGQMIAFTKRKEEEFQTQLKENQKKLELQEQALEQRLLDEKRSLHLRLEQDIRKSLTADFENKLVMLEAANHQNEERLKQARQRELDFLRKEQELINKEADLQIALQKQLNTERATLQEQISRQEREKFILKDTEQQLRLRELEKQLDDQKRLADEMRRKADQGSMQLQGEVQELLLEDILRDNFPFDLIEEVKKGSEGADCIQVVRNSSGKECGKIIYESKRALNWNKDWLEKLRNDMRNKGADMAILVTKVFPKEMERFGNRDGIWICSYAEVPSVAAVLRNAIMCVADAKKSEENRGEKMQMLYTFISGNEFRQQIESIAESFQAMQMLIVREKVQMEKIWKEREKQLQKAFISTVHLYGSMKGILGASVQDIPMLEGTDIVEAEE